MLSQSSKNIIQSKGVPESPAEPRNESECSAFKRWSPSGSCWKDYLHFCGPGWFVAIAYIDPGNTQADITCGASSGYNLLWTIWWATVLSIYVQVLCARMAVLGQITLAEVQRDNFPKYFCYVSWFIAEFSVIITDLPEVIGVGIAFNVFFGWPYYVGVLLSPITTLLFLATQEKGGMRYLEALIVILIGIMAIVLWVEMGMYDPETKELIEGWVYGFTKKNGFDIFSLIGVVGCVCMPHNLYLHTASVLSRPVERTHDTVRAAVFWTSIEPVIPIIISYFINLAIVTVAAEAIYYNDITVNDIGNTNFANYLTIAGGPALWGTALLASGQSSAITTTYSGQYIMDGFLKLKLAMWKRAIGTRAIALIPCVIVASVCKEQALNASVNFVNAALSILLPFALTPLAKFSTSEEFLGKENVPGNFERGLIWAGTFMVYFANAYALSAKGGGFFGDIMHGTVQNFQIGEQSYQFESQTTKSVQANIFNDLLQALYLMWNIYVIISPIKKPMRQITEVRKVEEEKCFGIVAPI